MLGFIEDLSLLPTSPVKFLIFSTLALLWKLMSAQFISGDRDAKAGVQFWMCPFLMCCVFIQWDSCFCWLNLGLSSVVTAGKESGSIYQFMCPFLLVTTQTCESSAGMFHFILWKQTPTHFVIGFWADWNDGRLSWVHCAAIFAFTGSFLHLLAM